MVEKRDDAAIVTSIRIPKRVWMLLRAIAEQKALEAGGRPSVSGAIVDLTESAAKAKAAKHA